MNTPEPTKPRRRYSVTITMTFSVNDIEADSPEEALEIAHANAVNSGSCDTEREEVYDPKTAETFIDNNY